MTCPVAGSMPRPAAVAAGLLVALLAGCPARPPVEGPSRDRCPVRSGGGGTGGWYVARVTPDWLVCRTGKIRYRAAHGTPSPGRLVPAPGSGDLVAFMENRGGRCEMLVLQEGDGTIIDPLRFPMPSCDPTWRPHWADLSTITVGPSMMQPKVRVRLERE
jgi:hypothetical protein